MVGKNKVRQSCGEWIENSQCKRVEILCILGTRCNQLELDNTRRIQTPAGAEPMVNDVDVDDDEILAEWQVIQSAPKK